MAYLNLEEEPRRVLLEMLDKGELCDLTVVCQETHRSYGVHALIMNSMSKDIIGDPLTRSIILPYSERTIEFLIKTAYEGAETLEVDVSKEDSLRDIIQAAIDLQIPELKAQVASQMLTGCSVSSMLDLLRTSRMFSGEEEFLMLSPCLMNFVAKNVHHLISTKAFLTFSSEEMKDLLGCRHLQLTREEAQSFLSSWYAGSQVQTITRNTRGILSNLAKRPSSFRLPATVILAGGGWSNDPTNLIEVFNPLDSTWKVTTNVQMPGSSRAYHGLEFVHNKIWCVGGYSQDGGFLSSLHAFNTKDGTWMEKSPMSTKRCYVATSVLDGKIFAFGGHSGGSAERLRTAEVYDPARNQWDSIAPMIHNRSDFTSVVLHGRIYVIGGFHGFHYQSTIESYNPVEDRWSQVGNLQLGPRSGASAVVLGDRIYVLGGYDGSQRLGSVECFTPGIVNNTWHIVPDMLHRRSNFSAVVVDSKTIMVVGGFRRDAQDEEGEVCGQVEFLDTIQNVWTAGPPINVPRSALRAVKVENFYG